MPLFIDKNGNVFRFVDSSGTVPDNLSTETENYTVNLDGGNYTHEIKGDFVQGNIVELEIEEGEEE
ncbi:hypothetical protein QUA54_33320 [Microcoleus sp. MOSTC5]|uniref:hypothetical protein n=1 Tax=Microcoleus sp. MOSTC5 TaxID=3055378 RepID=UPI002FD06258